MDHTQLQFRTAAFGGFQKQDVLNYLEASAKEHGEKIATLQKDLEEEQAFRREVEQNFETLDTRVRALVEENQRLTSDLAERETQLAEAAEDRRALLQQLEELQKLVTKLTPAAAAYEGVKDRTAGIELEAHGRAQSIEREAQQRVRKAQLQTEGWFSQVEAAYNRLRSDLEATLAHAAGEMERVSRSLGGISEELSGHDEALRVIGQQIKAMEPPKPPAPLPLDGQEE